MKKIILGLSIFAGSFTFAQTKVQGLENIIVEKYYVANAADKAVADKEATDAGFPTGTLPVGAVTYRVYADLLPGFKILSIYADTNRNQPLLIKSTTPFYNNSNGTTSASSTKASLKNKVLALDTYVTLGGAGTNVWGVLKADDDGTANNIIKAGNADSILLNKDPMMNFSLIDRDGLLTKTPNPIAPSFVGFRDLLDQAFGDGSTTVDSVFSLAGLMYSTSGAKGIDTLTNRVLIAQLTTGGKLSFHLNMLIQKGTDYGQFYVWGNPQPETTSSTGDYHAADILFHGLNYPDSLATDVAYLLKPINTGLAFTAYPNPANEQLNLDFTAIEPNSKGTYTIYGLLGNIVARKELSGMTGPQKEVVDISSLSQGIYTIQLNINGHTSAKKIIKN
jgi:hypothetical protein